MTVKSEPVVFGQHDGETMTQLYDVASRAERSALMADAHRGYIMPIGGVTAYHEKVSVAGVGFDIACGNAAIRTNLTLEQLAGRPLSEMKPHVILANTRLQELANELSGTLSFGIGRKNLADDAPVDSPLFDDAAWFIIPNTERYNSYRDELREKARRQLGTVGSGNHYVDVFVDENEAIWVGVHFGSRGFGHTIASNFMALFKGLTWGERPGPEVEALLDLDSQMGREYWTLMELAGRYAYVGREWVARKVVSILGGTELELVHNHHNFAWREDHDGETFIVVRKGATPAFPGQQGFVGGSMGDNAVILRGTSDPTMIEQQRATLYSTVHGAGRVLGRMEAKKGKVLTRDEKGKPAVRDKASIVTRQMMSEWTKSRGVIVRGGDVDESPHVYRRLPDVLTTQGGTIEVLHTLRPLIVVMAGSGERDPYRD